MSGGPESALAYCGRLLNAGPMTSLPTAVPRRVDAIDWPAWTPGDVATLCFILRGPEVLLIRKKRGLGAGKINGPGGRLDPGETPLQAAIREVEEELLVTPTGLTAHGDLRFAFVDGYRLQAA